MTTIIPVDPKSELPKIAEGRSDLADGSGSLREPTLDRGAIHDSTTSLCGPSLDRGARQDGSGSLREPTLDRGAIHDSTTSLRGPTLDRGARQDGSGSLREPTLDRGAIHDNAQLPKLPLFPTGPGPRERETAADSSESEAASAAKSGPSAVVWGRWGYWSTAFSRALRFPRTIYRARRGTLLPPRLLTHTVTFGCNAKCVMCDSWQLPTAGDLSWEEIDGIYRQLPPLDAVRLTGGEPFVRRDMLDIYHSAIEHLRPMFLHISSNGFLTKRIVAFCEQRDPTVPLELAISIDGVDDYHNEIRGNRSAFRSAWETLTELAKRQAELHLHLTVNQTVVNDAGLDQYELLQQRLKSLNVEHHLIVAYAESATYSLDRERRIDQSVFSTFSELSANKLSDVLRRAEAQAKSLPWIRRKLRLHYLRGVAKRILRGQSDSPRACQALHAHLRLFPNGDIPVCQFNSQIVGNLRQQSFAEVWKSVSAQEQRQWVRACHGCWAECEVAPNTIYTLDFKSRSPKAAVPK